MSSTHDTTNTDTHAETVTFGRTLVDGVPVDEGLTLPVDSPTLELLAERSRPLISTPVLSEYITALVDAEETDGEYAVGLVIFPAGCEGPAEHIHRGYDEVFEVVEGELVVELDGDPVTVRAGESVTAPAGTPHAFHNESDAVASAVVEARPAGKVTEVILFLFGLGHDGKVGPSGRPRFLQAMVMAEALGDDTVFTSPPPVLQRVLAKVFGPIGRLAGYDALDSKYHEDAFWEARVEQPPEP